MNAKRATLLAALLASCAGACAGASVTVTADRALYPISMSGSVRDQTGRLFERRQFQMVGRLHAERTAVGLFYSGLSLPRTYDISDEVNAQVAGVQGEAVVDLTVSISESCYVLNAFPVLNILPVWPGCVPVTVSGAIVRRRPQPPPPPPPPPEPPAAPPATLSTAARASASRREVAQARPRSFATHQRRPTNKKRTSLRNSGGLPS